MEIGSDYFRVFQSFTLEFNGSLTPDRETMIIHPLHYEPLES